MLKKCPECMLQVSDKASFCPHCGYPLKPNKTYPSIAKIYKRKRLPNGFGQITKIKGERLRRPFRAMITTAIGSNGRPICKLLKPQSYFATYNEAYEALVKFNAHPYDVSHMMTLKELYESWFEDYRDHSEPLRKYSWIVRACGLLKGIFESEIKSLEPFVIKKYVEKLDTTAANKSHAKRCLNMMFDYAVENGFSDRNPARMFKLSSDIVKAAHEVRNAHLNFSEHEWELLWKNQYSSDVVTMVLIQSCMGWRPDELVNIELKNVDIRNWTIVGGMKTEAGKNRIVPVHNRIRSMVLSWYERAKKYGSPYLFFTFDSSGTAKHIRYPIYRARFINMLEKIGLNKSHRLHDCRVHFVTECKKYGVDIYAIKYMVGHAITDITESIYTKRDPTWLRKELSKVEF